MSGTSTRKTNTEIDASQITVSLEAGESDPIALSDTSNPQSNKTLQNLTVPAGKRWRIRTAHISAHHYSKLVISTSTGKTFEIRTSPIEPNGVLGFGPDLILNAADTLTVEHYDCGSFQSPYDFNYAILILKQDTQ